MKRQRRNPEKVNDTHPKIEMQFRKLMLMKSNEERLLMGCSMFDAAKQIVKSSIYNQYKEITPIEMKEEVFIRFYGREFNREQKKKILSALR